MIGFNCSSCTLRFTFVICAIVSNMILTSPYGPLLNNVDWLSEEIRTMSFLPPILLSGLLLLSGIQSPANRPSVGAFRSASSVHQFYKFHFGQNLFISIESVVSVCSFTSCVLGNADCGYLYCRPRSPPLDMSIRCSTALGSGSQKYMGSYRIVIPLYTHIEKLLSF